MTEQVREKIVDTIKSWIQKNGDMPLRVLKANLRNAGIPLEVYEKIQPKAWIMTQFPEFEVVGTNGHEHIVIADKVLHILKDAVSKEGKFLLSGISPLLNAEGMDWKACAAGKRIYEWILDSYPDVFSISEDKLWLYPAEPAPTPRKTEHSPDPVTRSYTYQFCFFPGNGALLRLIKELTGDATMSLTTWANQRTFALAQCLLGLNGGMLDDSQGESPRMAFYTGMKTALNQDLYGIIVPNTNEGATQKWIFSTVAFPGQETDEGRWLCSAFGIKSQASYGDNRVKTIESISEALGAIQNAQRVLATEYPMIQRSIEDGAALSAPTAEALVGYLQGWTALKKALETAGEGQPEEITSIGAVQKLLDDLNDTSRVQKELEEKFTQLARDTWHFMEENMLCPENLAAKDIGAFSHLLQQNATGEIIARLREQLEPFRAVAVLRAFDPTTRGILDDAEYEAIDTINVHFGARLKLAQLKYSICNRDLDMSFLSLVLEVDALINQIENRDQAPRQDAYPLDDYALLKAAIDGTLWRVANRAFEKPNPLETAIMIGNAAAVQEILRDRDALIGLGYGARSAGTLAERAQNIQFSSTITPLHAAERLEQLLGPFTAVIDRCLLLGVMQHEEGAVEHLIRHYIDTDRPQLAGTLFNLSARTMQNDTRRQILLALVKTDCLSATEALNDDMLAFLTDVGIQLVKNGSFDEGLQGRLTALYEKIQPTLIHHIVFLSPELQSYILRPENANEVKKYCPDGREEKFAELFRQNAFERGNAPLQVAKRVYAFIGAWGDLALAFAHFSPDSLERQRFLFELFYERGDDLHMIQFLDENPDVKQEHLPYYFDLLFRNQMYAEICGVPAGDRSLSTRETLQVLYARLKTDGAVSELPEFDSGTVVEDRPLLFDICDALPRSDLDLYKEFLMRIFSDAVQQFSEEDLSRLVTADGMLQGDTLHKLAEKAADRCPALAIYCGRLLGTSEFSALRDAYLDARYEALAAQDPNEQKKTTHELCILNPEKYSILEENIFKRQLAELLERQEDTEQKARKISGLLRNSNLSSNTLHNAIVRIGNDPVFCYPKLYQELYSFIEDDGSLPDFLRVAYTFWEQGGEEYQTAFCSQILDGEKRGLLPDDVLIEYEDCLLKMSGSLDRESVQTCILHIEELRGRKQYLAFARYIAEQSARGDGAGFPAEDLAKEVSLLCDALEDDTVVIEDYLRYCARLVASLNDPETEAEDIGVLDAIRSLYRDPLGADDWETVEKMIPQARIHARGYALYYYAKDLGRIRSEATWRVEKNNEEWTAEKANAAWERCVNYCMTEDQDDLFFVAVRSWLQEINDYYEHQLPWYAVKYYMQTMQKLLEDSDAVLQGEHTPVASFPVCSEEVALPLIVAAIDVFKRIDQNKTNQVSGDDNHNSLRIIIELGLRLGCEELLLEKLSEELSGAYINLGLVVISRLLLTDKTDIAMRFLHHIMDSSVREFNYSGLLNKLASMSMEELHQWLGIESNRATLRFILPNGNAPDILRLQTLVISTYTNNESMQENCIRVVENLIDCYPRDVMCYKSLFIMCKEDYEEHLPRIYRALVGIFKNYHLKPRSMYTRDRLHILKLIEILRLVMEHLGEYDIAYESTTNLIRGYYHENDRVNPDEVVSMLNQLSEEVKGLFLGISKGSDAQSLVVRSLLGSVTENWVPFFREAYQHRISNWLRAYCVDKFGSTRGLLRGVLRVWQEQVSDAERETFIAWIREEMDREKDSVFSRYAMKQLNNLVSKINVHAVNWSMLRLPWEEHLVCLGNLKDLIRPEKNCCYKVMMLERPKGQLAKDSFIVMIRLAQDNLKAQLLYGNAREWFRKGDYDLAGAAYEALAITKIYPSRDMTRAAEYVESYETWMRISYVFLGIDMSTINCSQHSCMNMMCALINAGYAKYFDRLQSFFTGVNLKLFKAVRKVLASAPDENETVALRATFRRDQERAALIAFLHFILSKDQTGRHLFLSSQEKIDFETKQLRGQESTQNTYKRSKYWIPLQFRPLPSVFPASDDQEADYVPDETTAHMVIEANNEDFVPRLFSEIDTFATDDDGSDLRALLEEYHRLTPFSDGDCSKRLRISALICRRGRDGGSEAGNEKNLVRFGVDYYKYYYNRVRKDIDPELSKERVHAAMLDLAIYGLRTPSVNVEIIMSLPNWLQYCVRSFSTIDQLLQDYSQNRAAYASIIRLLSDTEYSDAANSLLEVLTGLLSVANRLGTNAIDIRSYQTAQSRLSEVSPTRDWVEMFAALNEMLRQAINKLDQRPSLKVTLFNGANGLCNDGLYGEIENTGRETASRLELQATFPDNDRQRVSSLYRLTSLRPNEKATFAISYRASESLVTLEYILNLTYSDKETRCAAEPIHGVLAIVPNVPPPDTVPKFDTERASAFTVDEKGRIVSPDFKGRKTEIRSLTSLLAGDDFPQYRSAIVQGIKRSGKTSLLNYLRTFIRAKREENTVQVFFDCQGVTRPYIYKVFFKTVLDELPLEYPQILSHPGWPDFVSRWRLQEGEEDRKPEDLGLFFRQLHAMMEGKGIYLIVDEFDVLLNQLNGDTGYDSLLQALRSLQMNPDCYVAIHMILCGSNYLLIYNQTGSAINQMFQSYETIPVGQMLASDIQEMISDWLAQYPFIHFAPAAEEGISPSIQWIERYTGGLVWYTRLLVNRAIQLVLKDRRNCVYPSDISLAFTDICKYQHCRQLAEGCDEHDKIVLDAMQSLSDRPRGYVSYEQLMQLLEPYMNAEQVRKSLTTLTDSVELLEQKSPNIHSYRFRIELYRRYFRTCEWLDGHESRFGANRDLKNQAGGDCFTIVETDANIETVDGNSKFDFI